MYLIHSLARLLDLQMRWERCMSLQIFTLSSSYFDYDAKSILIYGNIISLFLLNCFSTQAWVEYEVTTYYVVVREFSLSLVYLLFLFPFFLVLREWIFPYTSFLRKIFLTSNQKRIRLMW